MNQGRPRRRSRLRNILPHGLDSVVSSSRPPYSLAPEQLLSTLIDQYRPGNHVEHNIIKSAWYGKQTKAARHELILIEVQDLKVPLKNYVVLDRNNSGLPPDPGASGPAGILNGFFFQGLSRDAYTISVDGIEVQLLNECKLHPRKYLEKIEFSDRPLFLYQLAILAEIVSRQQYPTPRIQSIKMGSGASLETYSAIPRKYWKKNSYTRA